MGKGRPKKGTKKIVEDISEEDLLEEEIIEEEEEQDLDEELDFESNNKRFTDEFMGDYEE